MLNEGTNTSAPQSQVAQNVSSGVESNVPVSETVNNTVPTETKENTPEKTFTRDELAKITDRTKRETEDKVRREVLAEMQRKALESAEQLQSQVPQQTQTQPQPQIVQQQPNAQYLTREDLINLQRKQAEEIQNKMDIDVANSFMQKIELAKQENPEFEKEVMTPLKIGGLPMPIVNLLNSVDNVGDVLKEMADRPSTFTEIMNSYAWSPELARKALYRLSNSIKTNKDAMKQPKAEPPLSQIKQSPTGKDSGKMTVNELRKLPQYRG
jgi:hypothetical protein